MNKFRSKKAIKEHYSAKEFHSLPHHQLTFQEMLYDLVNREKPNVRVYSLPEHPQIPKMVLSLDTVKNLFSDTVLSVWRGISMAWHVFVTP